MIVIFPYIPNHLLSCDCILFFLDYQIIYAVATLFVFIPTEKNIQEEGVGNNTHYMNGIWHDTTPFVSARLTHAINRMSVL